MGCSKPGNIDQPYKVKIFLIHYIRSWGYVQSNKLPWWNAQRFYNISVKEIWMSRYIKIIWINIMEEWDFLNQLMVSELKRPFF